MFEFIDRIMSAREKLAQLREDKDNLPVAVIDRQIAEVEPLAHAEELQESEQNRQVLAAENIRNLRMEEIELEERATQLARIIKATDDQIQILRSELSRAQSEQFNILPRLSKTRDALREAQRRVN
jgi:chromosome segregation ATPase